MSRKKKDDVKGDAVYRVFPAVRRMLSEAYLNGLRDGRAAGYLQALANEGVEIRNFHDVMLDCDPQEAEFPCQDYLSQEGDG